MLVYLLNKTYVTATSLGICVFNKNLSEIERQVNAWFLLITARLQSEQLKVKQSLK